MARHFPGSTDRIVSSLTANNDLRSYSIWTYRTGEGANNLGRIWHKGTSGALLDTSHNNNLTDNAYDYNRRFSVSNGIWRYTRPAANEWHHLAITHDMSSDANDPIIYLDGIAVSISEVQVPSGTRADNATGYCVGNRSDDGSRGWDGHLAEFAVWNRILPAGEVYALAQGNTPQRYSEALMAYMPLWGAETKDFYVAAPTVTGTTEATDPPIYKAPVVQLYRPAMFLAGRTY